MNESNFQFLSRMPRTSLEISLFSLLSILSLFLIFNYFSTLLQSGFDTGEDLSLLLSVREVSLFEVFRKSHIAGIYEAVNYRPVISFLTKILYPSSSSPDPILYRVIQAFLAFLIFGGMLQIVNKRNLSVFSYFALIFVFFAVPWLSFSLVWWTDVGALINVVCFVFMLVLLEKRQNLTTDLLLTALVILALFSKEIGMVLAVGSLIVSIYRKRWLALSMIAVSVLSYLLIRNYVLGGLLYEKVFYEHIYYFNENLSADELNARYGDNPYPVYIHNVLMSLLSITFFPTYGGQVIVNALNMAKGAILSLSTLLILRYIYISWKHFTVVEWFMIIAIILNVSITFKYSAMRILPIGGLAYVLLLTFSIDNLVKSNSENHDSKIFTRYFSTSVLILLLAAWGGLALERQSVRQRQVMLTNQHYVNENPTITKETNNHRSNSREDLHNSLRKQYYDYTSVPSAY